jgi:hypothetical protein
MVLTASASTKAHVGIETTGWSLIEVQISLGDLLWAVTHSIPFPGTFVRVDILIVVFLLAVKKDFRLKNALTLQLRLEDVVHLSVILNTGQEVLNRVILV